LREPKSSTEVTNVLNEYKKIIDANKPYRGAFLSCVVGGKMSEGINFSDNYGRCVIVIGLPYPNSQDMELKEKMKYLDSIQKNSGNEYYEGLCMKAVNQSIGRSIRHIKDYATICLLDERYLQERIQKKLPMWIQKRIKNCPKYDNVLNDLKGFFKKKEIL
jgi:chromosome transmission fidelity protein 1